MDWSAKFRPSALKELEKLPREAHERILEALEDARTAPRGKGTAMKVAKRDVPMWRYRVGDYRIVCHLRDADQTILVLRIGHRREVYR